MATIVLAHGAWSAAWAWKKMRPLFRRRRPRVLLADLHRAGRAGPSRPPGDRPHTHINDVLAVLEFEDLKDVTLLGHSYGGMVATGVADKARRPHCTRRLYRRLRAQGRRRACSTSSVRKADEQHARQATGEGRRRLALPAQSRCRPTPRPRTSPGRRRAGARSRSRPSSRRSGCSRRRTPPPRHYIYAKKQRTGRRVPPVRRTRQERGGLEVLRDRRQPQSAHHLPAGADGAAHQDHGRANEHGSRLRRSCASSAGTSAPTIRSPSPAATIRCSSRPGASPAPARRRWARSASRSPICGGSGPASRRP